MPIFEWNNILGHQNDKCKQSMEAGLLEEQQRGHEQSEEEDSQK